MLLAKNVVTHTPPWVFLVFAYLLWQGVQSLRQRTLPLWRVLIVPALFIASGVSRIVGDSSGGIGVLLPWAAALAVFMPLAFVTGPRLLAVDRRNGAVTRPASPVPLARNVFVFILQYAAAVVTQHSTRGSHEATLAAQAISGATAGYFIGWAILVLRHYFTASEQCPGYPSAHSHGSPSNAQALLSGKGRSQ